MGDNEEGELLERAQSIVRKALSAISEDQEAEKEEEITLDDITMENDEDPDTTTEHKSIIETAITLSEAIITAISNTSEGSEVEPPGDNLSPSPSEEPEGLIPDQDSGSFISLHSTHSLKIPSAEPLEEEELEEEEEEEERREESRAEFVVRKNFENFTEYTKLMNDKDRLTEKRFLQVSYFKLTALY